ncbi:hypothetical protein [Fibrobacter sp. UWH4]|uniref:hypothetical protein n=1 Tax=Fibrobacter sp. UWH4 TaxID=1896210 RepID=UPI000918FEFA|nr:hypothetical protein [Fibrobacter sp. UWH4]SHL04442.1 hypothetical protein SAMN05720762_10448 [Fibrobacter sp. UWH4]
MATAISVSASGISVKSYREIRNELEAKFKGLFGDELDTTPSSPDGQLIDLFAYAYSEAAEAIQGAASALDLDSSYGVFLDNLGALMGIPRNSGEDDDSYRGRLVSSDTTGFATYDAMLTYLRKELGSSVTMKVNDEPETDGDGIPGHHIAVYIPESVTKTDNEIAQAIFDCKAAGVPTYGSSSGTAEDMVGLPHIMKFNRIEGSDAYFMRITITEYEEEVLPDDFASKVAASVAEWALTEYRPGQDIIPQRVVQAVYEVPGIDTVTVEVSANGSTGWTSSRVPVSADTYAVIPEENITVTKV